MGKRRRAHRQNLSFTAAFTLIQALRDPSSEHRYAANRDFREDGERKEESLFASQRPGVSGASESYESFCPDFLNTLSRPFSSEESDREKRNRP